MEVSARVVCGGYGIIGGVCVGEGRVCLAERVVA